MKIIERIMCILFIYIGNDSDGSDYRMIMISNRDELYDRAAAKLASWTDDANVVGGRDLVAGGTWLAVSPLRKKLGVLLNLPLNVKKTDRSRGDIVTNYVKSDLPIEECIEDMRKYDKECNEFLLVTLEFGSSPKVNSYSNATNELTTWKDDFLGFGNSLPETPLKKVIAGKKRFQDICNRLNKVTNKEKLIEECIQFLRWEESHLPDPFLEECRPTTFKELSSVYVHIPHLRYGTRTHTLLLVAKTGHVDLLELTMQSPVDPLQPVWERTEFQYDI